MENKKFKIVWRRSVTMSSYRDIWTLFITLLCPSSVTWVEAAGEGGVTGVLPLILPSDPVLEF